MMKGPTIWVKTILPKSTPLWEFYDDEYNVLFTSNDLEKAKEQYDIHTSAKKYNL